MTDNKRIKEEGIRLIEEFSKMLEQVPDTEETHYVVDMKNITREDKEPAPRKNFHKKLEKNAPAWEDGYVIAEKGV